MEINYDKLFSYMYEKHISKSALAEKAGISRNTIIKMEKGEPVHLAIIIAICDAYGFSISDIVQEGKSQENKK